MSKSIVSRNYPSGITNSTICEQDFDRNKKYFIEFHA
jgi:hypothetical protein